VQRGLSSALLTSALLAAALFFPLALLAFAFLFVAILLLFAALLSGSARSAWFVRIPLCFHWYLSLWYAASDWSYRGSATRPFVSFESVWEATLD
jgi:hypothetical protein